MKRSLLLLTAALCVCLGGTLQADPRKLPLRVWAIRLPGNQLGLEVADMNGDGQQDLVIAHMADDDSEDRTISVYYQGPRNQRFGASPSWSFKVPMDACVFAAGDLDPAAGGEVVLLCPTRLLLVGKGKQPIELARIECFFDYPERGNLLVWNLVRDLNGDGRAELIIPTKTGYSVFSRGGPRGTLRETSRLKVPVEQRFGPAFETALLDRFLTSRTRLRRLIVSDLNGDGRLDLVVYREKGLARFHQRPDGTFPLKPDREEPLKTVLRAERVGKKGKGSDTESFSNVRLTLADVDEDGQSDLVVTQTRGKVGVFETLRTRQLVFRGRKGKHRTWDENRPDTLINIKGVSGDPVFLDWDGDGRKDLIVSSYRMDMFSNVKRAILKTLTIEHMVFLQQSKGRLFNKEPDTTSSVDVPLESIQRRGGHRAVLLEADLEQHRAVLLEADLDGDSIHDRVTRQPSGGLQVMLGTKTEKTFGGTELGFDEDNPINLNVHHTEPPIAVDLDGDGKDELILEPFSGDGKQARVVYVVGVAR